MKRLRLMQISCRWLRKSSSSRILSVSSRKRTLSLKESSNSNKTCMKLYDLIEIFTLKIWLRHKMRWLNWRENSRLPPIKFLNLKMKLKPKIRLCQLSMLIWQSSRNLQIRLPLNLKIGKLNTRLLTKSDLNKMPKSRSWPPSSNFLMKKSKRLRKITRMWSMKEIFLVHNLSEEMTSWLSFTRRSRFSKTLWLEVKSNIKRDLRISDFLNSKLEITRVNWESLNLKRPKFQILERKSITYRDNSWLRDSK